MDNIRVEQKTNEWSRTRRRKKAWQRVLAGMMAVVVFSTTYALILPAITKEQETFCGHEEHEHIDACYERVLICGYPADEQGAEVLLGGGTAAQAWEGEGMTGDPTDADASNEGILTSPAAPQDDSMIEDVTPAPAGGDETEVLAVDVESVSDPDASNEGILTSPAAPQNDSNGEGGAQEGTTPAPDRHVHTDECYELQLVCGLEAHAHSLACFSDPEADLEDETTWAKSVEAVELTGVWADDVLAIAKSQLGQGESADNYMVDENGEKQGYTRYAAWWSAEAPYDPWCAMFVSFCLDFAKVDKELFPQYAGCAQWQGELEKLGLWREASFVPQPGDLIFFDYPVDGYYDGVADHVGLVTEVTDAEISTIEGNNSAKVEKFTYKLNDSRILGYGLLPENPEQPEASAAEAAPPAPERGDNRVILSAETENGVTVILTGTTESLPWPIEELELRAVPIEDENAKALIEGETETAAGDVRRTVLFDITILRNGEEVQPLGEVKVRFAGLVAPKDDAQVFYVDAESETVEEVTAPDAKEGEVAMVTGHFTVYGASWTIGEIAKDYVPGAGVLTGFELRSTVTGTEPFDADNEPGNDKDAENLVVRSFDTVYYNLAYTLNVLNPNTAQYKGYENARLYLQVTLPLAANQAAFDLDGMAWLDQGAAVTDNGTSQTLRGSFTLRAGEGADYVVPGTGSLRLVVNVKDMPNGATVQPSEISLWLDNGDNTNVPAEAATLLPAPASGTPAENETIPAVTVSSAPQISIRLHTTGAVAPDRYLTGPYLIDGIDACQLNVGVVVVLGSGGEKGMKGGTSEIPEDVSFELYSSYEFVRGTLPYGDARENGRFLITTVNRRGSGNTNSATLTGHTPRLLDYSPILNNGAYTGVLGKNMVWGNYVTSQRWVDHIMGRTSLPWSDRSQGTTDRALMNSGTMTVTQGNGTDQRLLVSFSGIQNDGTFPSLPAITDPWAYDPSYGLSYDRILACGVIALLVPRENDFAIANSAFNQYVNRDFYVRALRGEMTMPSGNVFSLDSVTLDAATLHYLHTGQYLQMLSYAGSHLFDASTYELLASNDNRGAGNKDARMVPGDEFFATVYYGESLETRGGDYLIWWDRDIIEPMFEDGSQIWRSCDDGSFLYYREDFAPYDANVGVKVYFLWINPDTNMTQFGPSVKYESLSAARAAGVVPNAAYIEWRSLDNRVYSHRAGAEPRNCVVLYPHFRIRMDAPITPRTSVAAASTRWNYMLINSRLYAQDVRGYTLKNYTSYTSWPLCYDLFQNSQAGTWALNRVSTGRFNIVGWTSALPTESYRGGRMYRINYVSPGRDENWNFVGTDAVGNTGVTMNFVYSDGRINTPQQANGHYGTFIVMAYRAATAIDNAVAQLHEGAERGTYALDSGERCVDYTLKPSLTVTEGDASSYPETVTITDLLPKGLKYKPGSAVLGGEYRQPTDRISHGTVIDGADFDATPLALGENPGLPVCDGQFGKVTFTVTENTDGTSELKWVLENVIPGRALPQLHFSATLGDATDPTKDVADGERLKTTATIHMATAGTASDEAVIEALKLDSATLIKRVKKQNVELGEEIRFALDYINDSGNRVAEVELRDVLPFKKTASVSDPRGSDYHGRYRIKSLTVESLSSTSFTYTVNAATSNAARSDAAVADPFSYTGSFGGFTTGSAPTMLQILLRDVDPGAVIRVELALEPYDQGEDKQLDGDIYYNDIAMRSNTGAFPDKIKTATVFARVVNPTLLINKVDKANHATKLGGAVFTLKGSSAAEIARAQAAGETPAEDVSLTATTGDGENGTTLGLASFLLKPGTYTLTEITPPANYRAVVASWTVAVAEDGKITITPVSGTADYDAATKTLTVENETDTVELTVKKQVLVGSTSYKFPIRVSWTTAAGTTSEELSLADGEQQVLTIPSGATNVTVTETEHAGYTVMINELVGTQETTLASTDTYSFDTPLTANKTVVVVNTAGEELPESGGMGTALPVAFGLVTMAGALGLGLVRRRRRGEA